MTYDKRYDAVVARDGTGDFTSVQEAVDRIPPKFSRQFVIYIRNGIYKEKLRIDKTNVHLVGEDPHRTVITYDDYAKKSFPDGEQYHTFNSYSVLIAGDDFQAEDVTFANTAGRGDGVGQAVAVYVDGDRALFRRCRFLGAQDTLFTGPLPPAPVDRAFFGGPRDIFPRRSVRQYFEDCYIRGDVDFIFGSASAVFNRCEIYSAARFPAGDGTDTEVHSGIHGWITAASTPEAAAFGYVFLDCDLTGDAPPQSVYLGRPWREHAHVAFIRCRMGAHIAPEGWHNWGKPERERTVKFCEYGSSGPGAAPDRRVGWSIRLSDEEADRYTVARVLASEDGWNPEKECGRG